MTVTAPVAAAIDQPSAAPRILNMVNAQPGWVATVYYYEKLEDGGSTVTATERHRVIAWALVEHDGGTDFEPAFVTAPGFPTCASLYNSHAPDHVVAYAHYEPDATDLTDPRIDR
ncbi:hypothetical protein [Streptomyces pacificus]|uniref:Uncharacterized protein n=1 Tax=Streptomyces pacificus TaxID=2705029 RepID=A0A6A0B1B9_9ACTN|nr:hypothetical protein [Streptomyces pacificus]GFH38882.1 hypothetical protein SCWH03_51450 [Streptomyces pacificus]